MKVITSIQVIILFVSCFGLSCFAACPTTDLTADCFVNFKDFSILADWWLSECNADNLWCNGADVDRLGNVDIPDVLLMASEWLEDGLGLTVELERDIASVRYAIHLYIADHNNLLPGTANIPFIEALTGTTDINGNAGTDYGPYLNAIPYNPFTNLNTVDIDGTIGDNSHGWQFDSTTGEFKADHELALQQLIISLLYFRQAIDKYREDHSGHFPMLAMFEVQLTQYTDIDGSTNVTKTADFCYGPYLHSIPHNPYTEDNVLSATPLTDWVYDEWAGEIHAGYGGTTAITVNIAGILVDIINL